MTEVITLSESQRLISLERTIEAGRKTFAEVGVALAEIRDFRLYRSDYTTFEDYCRKKWGWQRQRAYELIAAAEVANGLPAKCNQKITNENQAAALALVDPEKRVEVLELVAASGPITAKAIKEVAIGVEPINFIPSYRPSIGMKFASMAIEQLKRIDPKDTERVKALEHVVQWVKSQLAK